MVADTHVGAGSVLTVAVGLAQVPVCCTLVHVWKGKGKMEREKDSLQWVFVENPNTI